MTTLRQLRRLWRLRDFRWLLLSQATSTVGDRLVVVALALLVIERTGSAADLGLVLGTQTAVLVSLTLLGGVWADRLPRNRIMVSTDVARGGLHVLLAVLIFTDTLTLWQLIAIEVLFAAAEAFFRPALSGLIPQTVPEELIQDATAVSQFMQRLGDFAGPALATALVVTVGTGAAFAVDAATFFVSAGLLALVRPRRRGHPEPRTSFARELRQGYREVRERSWVWATIVVASLHIGVGFAPYVVLGPVIANQHYGSASAWGWLAAAIGLGSIGGALLALRFRPRRPLVSGFVAVAPFGALLIAYAAGWALVAILPVAVISGAGVTLFNIWWETALAEHIPPGALSRAHSYDQMGSQALLPLGAVAAGVIAEQLGADSVMTAGGVIAIALAAIGLAPRQTRALRSAKPSPSSRPLEPPPSAPPRRLTAHDAPHLAHDAPETR